MEQYDGLREPEKADAIMRGNFLADRKKNGLIVQMYSIGNFMLRSPMIPWRIRSCATGCSKIRSNRRPISRIFVLIHISG